jgi:O-antigen chain-terminating methyltransferase
VTSRFYRAFEDKYRGSRDLIKSRLQIYLGFIRPLAAAFPHARVFDMGCGRGEWLELLQENQVAAYGMDLDEGMLAASRELGLQVSAGDAIAHLKTLPEQTLLAVSGFHIAEHLDFAALQTLFAEAHRVLLPGGVLILETPNPENLVVGSASFYIDPTHQRPLPSQLLSFLAEYHGYNPVKILRLQEETRLADGAVPVLYDVLGGVSPDYAIVARSSGGEVTIEAFEQACGVSLYDLASRYDAHLQSTFVQWQQQHEKQLQINSQLLALSQQNAAQRAAILASRSWRLTRPFRWLARLWQSRS